ncbi:tetratricopeptide repeat protein [Desulfatitalea tepidiphila]|uniref:tetratricopeptide repeat protein n=1 Tax=Desulfatitalea tepidiphila TaxID=1185843 RepID=UPI0006B44906|nr:tetratricopeptide repeat protein [Desulfatitalea tepidiphila]
MILRYKSCLLQLLCLCFLMGCQGVLDRFRDNAGHDAYVPEFPSAVASSNAAAYYYFSLAQMKLKSGDLSEAKWYLEKAMQFDPRSVAIRMELANLHLLNNDTDAALTLVQQVLIDHPDSSDALTLAGRIYQQKKMDAEAKAFYEKALAGNPSDPNIYIHLGRIYWNERNLANAERIFRLMAKNFPGSYAAHFFNGKVLADQGKFDEAIAAFNRSLELEPSLEETRFELIDIYRKRQMNAEVVKTYESILDYSPDNIRASFELAVYFREIGKAANGLPLLLNLGARSQNDNSILSHVYENYLETKQYETAAWIFEGMLKGAPGSSELHYLAGVTYDGLNRAEKASSHLEQVAPSSRFYANAMIHRAVLKHDTGQVDQAIDIIRQALKTDPEQAEYYLYLGSFYEESKRYKEASDILEKGLALDAENVRMRFRLGVVFDKMGRRQEAIALMEKVLLAEPDNVKALNYLGYTYAEMGIELDKAEALVMRALKLKPQDGYITDSLAWVYFKQGKYEQALIWLEKAVALVPDDPVILEHLGDVYQKLNKSDLALKYYQRSLEIESKDREDLAEKIRAITKRP